MAVSRKFSLIALILQVVIFILFYLFVTYQDTVDCKHHTESTHCQKYEWSIFIHVHIMIFFGIGFLLVFLRTYGYSSVSFNLLIGVLSIEWGILVGGFFRMKEYNNTIPVSIYSMFEAEFAAATTLISFCCFLGRVSPLQSLVLVLLEIPFTYCNIYLNEKYFGASDIGGSMLIHMFACYFGLAVSYVLYVKSGVEKVDHKIVADKTSDLFSMVGTVFLWILWPSFNAAVETEPDAHLRCIVNTYVALCGGTVATFMTSALTDPKRKLTMAHIQNATLAAGVSMGAIANLRIEPWGALFIGFLGGFISTLGFARIQPWLYKKFHILDNCGVHNLHGMPGLLSAIAAIVCAALQTDEKSFGFLLTERSGKDQALWQLACLGSTFAISIGGGIITGLLMRLPIFDLLHVDEIYEDEKYFNIEDHHDKMNGVEYVGVSSVSNYHEKL